jgi:hypothetical protein
MAILRKSKSPTPPQSRTATTPAQPNRLQRQRSAASKNGNKFNPKLIFSQILAIQSLHYIILCLLIQLNFLIFNTNVTIDRIFTAKHLSLWTREGRIDAMAIFISSLCG